VVSAIICAALAALAIRGLSLGKWVHKAGGVLMVVTFATLLLLPWLNLATGTLSEFHPLTTAAPVISVMSLNLLGKMGFGALGGFEYVAIHAGECREPVRTIARSVVIAAPIIAVMFILGTSSVLALIPIDQIDLIAPIPQVLSTGFQPLGRVAWVAPVTIVVLLIVRVAQASVLFTGNTRLPMVAGWDGLLPSWFTRLHDRHRTPVNSVVFVAAITFIFSLAGLVGVGKQEGFQLLWNASAIFYALTYLVMFAIPIVGLRAAVNRPPDQAGIAVRFADDIALRDAFDPSNRERHEPRGVCAEDHGAHRRHQCDRCGDLQERQQHREPFARAPRPLVRTVVIVSVAAGHLSRADSMCGPRHRLPSRVLLRTSSATSVDMAEPV
jgi:amino acid transporter